MFPEGDSSGSKRASCANQINSIGEPRSCADDIVEVRLYQNHPLFLPKISQNSPATKGDSTEPLLAGRHVTSGTSVDPAEPCQAGPIEKGVTQVIAPDEHSPATGGGLRQNKSISKWQTNTLRRMSNSTIGSNLPRYHCAGQRRRRRAASAGYLFRCQVYSAELF